MPQLEITVGTPIVRTERVQLVEGIFDMPVQQASTQSWQADLPIEARPWHIGLIVGPSGCGKTTLARHLWPGPFAKHLTWDAEKSVVDDFPDRMSVRDVVHLLCSVGFSSPPYWLRPYRVLSTGQQFRVTLARMLAEGMPGEPVVCDEFTAVVDRTVAQVGSHALAKTIRTQGRQFVAVTCHEDVESWLNPDWVYRPAENTFTWRFLQPRPAIRLAVFRCPGQAWELFRHHHYLDTSLHKSASCWLATWSERPVCFSAWLHSITNFTGKREHRTVTLPDYQGAGIGHVVSTLIASMWKGLGYRATSTTTHPAMRAARLKDRRNWMMTRAPAFGRQRASGQAGRTAGATTRLTAGFEFVGKPLPTAAARALHSS